MCRGRLRNRDDDANRTHEYQGRSEGPLLNTVRDYYSLKPLRYSKTLSKQAQVWANHLEEIDQLNLSEDTLGETLYALDKSEFVIPKNIYLDAAVGWLEAFEEPEYYQTLCGECEQVGFGIAENELNIYVVAKYDKIYD